MESEMSKNMSTASIERARQEGGVEAIKMICEQPRHYSNNIISFLKIWRDKYDKE